MPFVKNDKRINRNGRPKGSYSIHTKLEQAIEAVEKEQDIDIYKHFVEEAIKDKTVLISLLRKLVPDRQFSEGETQKIINIVYAYRNDKSNDSALRSERPGATTPSQADSTKGS